MYYIIDTSTGLYFHKQNEIILFDSFDKANWFKQTYFQWSMTQLLSMGRHPMEFFGKERTVEIRPVDFDVNNVKTINFDVLMQNRKMS